MLKKINSPTFEEAPLVGASFFDAPRVVAAYQEGQREAAPLLLTRRQSSRTVQFPSR